MFVNSYDELHTPSSTKMKDETIPLYNRQESDFDLKQTGENEAVETKLVDLQIPTSNIELRPFLNQVVPPGCLLQLIIERNKRGFLNTLYPSYKCYHESSGLHLMSSRKKAGNVNSNFEINMDESYVSAGIIGKVVGNFTGSKYVVYDCEGNESKAICVVGFNSNTLGNSVRKITASIPRVEIHESKGIFVSEHPTDVELLKSKEPVWNKRLKHYVLNFNGRARIPSIKNFQLIDPEKPDYIMMQYGKMNKDVFSLDVRFPLSPLQAFGLAIASVDDKLL